MFLVLTGFMGSGKSSLLETWQKSFSGPSGDLDHIVAESLGLRPDQLGAWISKEGFEKFRSLETKLLKELLAKHSRYLLALGGGAFHSENQKLIHSKSNAQALWIETPIEECWRRVRVDDNRPLVAQGEVAFKELYQQRVPDYRQAKYRLLGSEPWPNFSEFCKKYNLKSLIEG